MESIYEIGSGPNTEHDDDPHSEIAEAQAEQIRERWMQQWKEPPSPKADAAD